MCIHVGAHAQNIHMCMHVGAHAFTQTYMWIHMYTHVGAHATHRHIHVGTHMCMHTHAEEKET